MSGAYGRVAVLYGGRSAEREISLISGQAVYAALRRCGVDATPIDVGDDLLAQLQAGRFDRAFIALHGRGGEDGTVQGALELLGLPYTGSGVLASALAMDKVRTKQIWQAYGLPTAPWVELHPGEAHDAALALGLPLAVKPAHEGSSLGMSKVVAADQLANAVELAARYDRRVLVERWIEGGEYTAGILGHQPLPLIRLETPNLFYDYEAKYHAETTRYHCPCGLPLEQESRLQALALAAFDAVGAQGWGRVDLMLDGSGQPWLIELNTIPGLTDHSLVPMAANVAGIDFDALVLRILESAGEGVE